MSLPTLEVDVQKGMAQMFHIGGILAGWGTALAAGILTIGHLLPAGVATRYGLDITGISAAVGTASTWLMTHTRTTMYKSQMEAKASWAFSEVERLEALVGLNKDEPSPTIPKV